MPITTVSALKNIVAYPPTVLKSDGGGPHSFQSRLGSSKRSKMPETRSSKFESVFSSNKMAKGHKTGLGNLLTANKSDALTIGDLKKGSKTAHKHIN